MCKICSKVLTIFIVVIAVAMAVVASVWREQGMAYIVFVSRFFDVMLPVLAVGCLLKYILAKPACGCGCGCDCGCMCGDSCKKDQSCCSEESCCQQPAAPAKKGRKPKSAK